MDGHGLVLDAALHRRPRGLLVLLGDVDAFGALDDDLVALAEDERDLTGLADVLALDDLDAVTLLQLELGLRLRRHHNTSGASETIRTKRRSRNSRPTGPKIRVPRAASASLMSTTTFSSKRM